MVAAQALYQSLGFTPIERYRADELIDTRFFELSLLSQRLAVRVERLGKIGLPFQRAPVTGDRFVRFPLVQSGIAQAVVELGIVGIGCQTRAERRHGVGWLRPGLNPGDGQPGSVRHTGQLGGALIGRQRLGFVGFTAFAVEEALHQRGWQVQVWDQLARPAMAASGNAGGIFHGSLHAQDGPHARLLRAAALQATRSLRPLLHSGAVAGKVMGAANGLLRLSNSPLQAMQTLLDAQGLPAEYVSALDAPDASRLAGVAWPGPAWLYAGGGWLAPPSLIEQQLQGLRFLGHQHVAALRPCAAGWQLLDAIGGVLAETAVVVLANASDAQRLLAPWGAAAWPLRPTRGQISGFWPASAASKLMLAHLPHVPIAGDGYALSLPEGGVLFGATASLDDPDASVRDADHQHNLQRLARLSGLRPAAGQDLWGRVAWRAQSDDRLPIAGPLPSELLSANPAVDQTRRLARMHGLFVCTALGARGITWAPLLGEVLAAQICGTPLPLEQSLLDAIDPGRWQVRAKRRQIE